MNWPYYHHNPRLLTCSKCGEPFHTKRTCTQRNASPRKKVFFYVPIHPELARQFPDRKYPPHVTLLHVGDLTRKQWKKVLEVADEILANTSPFQISLTHYDEFPTRGDDKYPHMVAESTSLEALHHVLKDAIKELYITVKHYGFTPHATLTKIPKRKKYRGPTPTGSWIADQVVVTGFEDYTYSLEGEGTPQTWDDTPKKAIIMRGVPGAGKSYYLSEHYPDAAVASADDFFTRHGRYKYVPKLAWLAHKTCFENYVSYLDANLPLVAVDNTNLTKSEIKKYRDVAIDHGYEPTIITILEYPDEAYDAGTHGVSYEKIIEMNTKLHRTKIPNDWDHQIIDYT
jgi:2'-5' RNA ligase